MIEARSGRRTSIQENHPSNRDKISDFSNSTTSSRTKVGIYFAKDFPVQQNGSMNYYK
jgi:hypothetical protein